jgi:hypothetical protein
MVQKENEETRFDNKKEETGQKKPVRFNVEGT